MSSLMWVPSLRLRQRAAIAKHHSYTQGTQGGVLHWQPGLISAQNSTELAKTALDTRVPLAV
jgi:hypothetical protein